MKERDSFHNINKRETLGDHHIIHKKQKIKRKKKLITKNKISIREKINIGSFNPISFCSNQTSKLNECANFMLQKDIPILAIQRHVITFDPKDNNDDIIKTINIGDSFYFTFSSANNGSGGVGFIYHKCISRFNPIFISVNKRIIQLKFNISKDIQYNILSIYCPTADSEHRIETQETYKSINDVIRTISNRQIIVVCGDINTMLDGINLNTEPEFNRKQLQEFITENDLYAIHSKFPNKKLRLFSFRK